MHKINNETEQEIYAYLNERFELHKNLFLSYSWYTSNSSNIYLGPKQIESKLNISSPGIVALRKSKTYKPTTNFLQLFGPHINKSLFNIYSKETIDFCKGKDILSMSFLQQSYRCPCPLQKCNEKPAKQQHFALLCFALLCFTLLCFALLGFVLLYFALLRFDCFALLLVA